MNATDGVRLCSTIGALGDATPEVVAPAMVALSGDGTVGLGRWSVCIAGLMAATDLAWVAPVQGQLPATDAPNRQSSPEFLAVQSYMCVPRATLCSTPRLCALTWCAVCLACVCVAVCSTSMCGEFNSPNLVSACAFAVGRAFAVVTAQSESWSNALCDAAPPSDVFASQCKAGVAAALAEHDAATTAWVATPTCPYQMSINYEPPDTSGSDTSGSDTSGSDTSGSDTSGSDTSGSDTSGSSTSGSDSSDVGSNTGPDAATGSHAHGIDDTSNTPGPLTVAAASVAALAVVLGGMCVAVRSPYLRRVLGMAPSTGFAPVQLGDSDGPDWGSDADLDAFSDLEPATQEAASLTGSTPGSGRRSSRSSRHKARRSRRGRAASAASVASAASDATQGSATVGVGGVGGQGSGGGVGGNSGEGSGVRVASAPVLWPDEDATAAFAVQVSPRDRPRKVTLRGMKAQQKQRGQQPAKQQGGERGAHDDILDSDGEGGGRVSAAGASPTAVQPSVGDGSGSGNGSGGGGGVDDLLDFFPAASPAPAAASPPAFDPFAEEADGWPDDDDDSLWV